VVRLLTVHAPGGHYLPQEEIMTRRRQTTFVREAQYGAEVDVELIDEEVGWSPYLSLEDVQRLDDVREAWRRGDLKQRSLHVSSNLRPLPCERDDEHGVEGGAP
jgi:hypothetical protein